MGMTMTLTGPANAGKTQVALAIALNFAERKHVLYINSRDDLSFIHQVLSASAKRYPPQLFIRQKRAASCWIRKWLKELSGYARMVIVDEDVDAQTRCELEEVAKVEDVTLLLISTERKGLGNSPAATEEVTHNEPAAKYQSDPILRSHVLAVVTAFPGLNLLEICKRIIMRPHPLEVMGELKTMEEEKLVYENFDMYFPL